MFDSIQIYMQNITSHNMLNTYRPVYLNIIFIVKSNQNLAFKSS